MGYERGRSVQPTAYATSAQPVPAQANPHAAPLSVAATSMDAGEFGGTPTTLATNATGPSGRGGRRGNFKLIQFPKDLGISSQHSHYMMFSTHAIKGSVGASGSDNSFGKAEGFVMLPIPANPTAAYEQGWDTEEAGIAMSGLVTGTQDVMAAYNKPTEYDDFGNVTKTAGLSGAAGSIMNKLGETGKTVAEAGVVGNIGKLVGSRALGQSTGQAIFDQSFAVYGGPAYRSFSFSYSLMPLSRDDTEKIKDIVNFFKINSAPESKGPGTVARIYGLPKAFQIKYYNKSRENQYMNKIGKCALTSINVTYGGERFTTFDGMDAPVQVNLNLSFKELQLQDSTSMAAGY